MSGQDQDQDQLPSEISILVDSIRASIQDINLIQLKNLSTNQSIDQTSLDSITLDIKQELARLDRNIDDLEILADECEDDMMRSNVLKLVEENRGDANRLRSVLRTISLELKQRIASSVLKSSREELLSGATNSRPSHNRSTNPDEALMSASSDVAQSLRHTLEVMREELDRSVLSTHLLEQQTATLKLASDHYSGFGELMNTSRALISSLKRANLLDRLLLSGALLFFTIVCLYILKKRILDRGLSLLSALISPLRRASKTSTKTSLSASNDDLLTTTIAAATATAAALLPGLVKPDVTSQNPPAQEPKKLTPRPLSTQPYLAAHPKDAISAPDPFDDSGPMHEEL
ncbi:hypothetical protein O181_012676 [Austropuccinia psidii MF-1]|uniref:Sec20 C-terminal domain-containing protein n=1 Tax=Austropuccinia psidii MF-1 TaxID=1389203 RepID=A0A9Q3GMI9_9BASI|nr:hypothetical protein [Austropuccinia psidii MF-1]